MQESSNGNVLDSQNHTRIQMKNLKQSTEIETGQALGSEAIQMVQNNSRDKIQLRTTELSSQNLNNGLQEWVTVIQAKQGCQTEFEAIVNQKNNSKLFCSKLNHFWSQTEASIWIETAFINSLNTLELHLEANWILIKEL